MWKPSYRAISSPFFSNNISVVKSSLKKGLSYYYFPNDILNKNATSFNKNSLSNLQFTPNYRIASNSYLNRSLTTATSVTSAKDNTSQSSSLDAVASICHPSKNSKVGSQTTSTSHIPFDVKAKQTKKDERSVLEQYLQGEKKTLRQLTDPYLTLTKPHLTFLIMLSSICSYALAPNSTNVAHFIFLTIGTLMASGAANAINMGREPNFDSQMVRTSARPVVTGLIKPKEAYTFAAITGSIGCTILYFGVNPTVAALGLSNIVLYSWIYTSLKRKSILNTWVGALVGAIPPLMGWAACSSLADPGAWCLALLLYAWQFPHFNSLSHNIKDEYKRAGYVMTAFVNPKLNARVALRYSLLMFPICFAMSYFGVCDNYFVLDSSILNFWMTFMAFKFWLQQQKNYSKATIAKGGPSTNEITLANVYAKKTFWSSIWQLPAVLVLAMLHKQGQWDRFFGDSEEKKLE